MSNKTTTRRPRHVIVGGGTSGTLLAYRLLLSGCDVILIELGDCSSIIDSSSTDKGTMIRSQSSPSSIKITSDHETTKNSYNDLNLALNWPDTAKNVLVCTKTISDPIKSFSNRSIAIPIGKGK